MSYWAWFALIVVPFTLVAQLCGVVGTLALAVVWWTADEEGRAYLRKSGYER